MADIKIKTPYNAHTFPKWGEVNDQPSETIPDQSMPVSEIMRRFASGLPIDGEKVSFYDEDPDNEEVLPDLSKMDLADRQELLESNRRRISYLQQQLDEIKQSNENVSNQGTITDLHPTEDGEEYQADPGDVQPSPARPARPPKQSAKKS